MSVERPPRVELVVDEDCPNVEAARAAVAEALARERLPARWIERLQPAASKDERGGRARRPSPTVLVDGRDVEAAASGTGCRIYRNAEGRLVGAPPVETVVAALRRAREAG